MLNTKICKAKVWNTKICTGKFLLHLNLVIAVVPRWPLASPGVKIGFTSYCLFNRLLGFGGCSDGKPEPRISYLCLLVLLF